MSLCRDSNILVDFGLEGFVGVVCAQKVGMADKKALFVVVSVDEPACDSFGSVAADLAGIGMKHIHSTGEISGKNKKRGA